MARRARGKGVRIDRALTRPDHCRVLDARIITDRIPSHIVTANLHLDSIGLGIGESRCDSLVPPRPIEALGRCGSLHHLGGRFAKRATAGEGSSPRRTVRSSFSRLILRNGKKRSSLTDGGVGAMYASLLNQARSRPPASSRVTQTFSSRM